MVLTNTPSLLRVEYEQLWLCTNIQLLEEYEAPPIDPTLQQALLEFVERREQELLGVELYS